MKPVISVAIATYNGEKFILEQLESIIRQTRKVDEIIIHDDISKDQTVAVVNDYIKSNNLEGLIKITVNEKNLGYASNFISALRETNGDYVFFCDQDDIWIDTRVEEMIGVMENNPEIGLLGSEFEPFKCSEDAPDVPKWELAKFKNDGSVERLTFNSENIFIGCQGCTMVMRRNFMDAIDSFWYEGWAHDEYAWKLALSMDRLFFYHKTTLKRRLHSNNVTLHKEHKNEQRLKYLYDLKKSHEQTYWFIQEYLKNEKDKLNKGKLLKKHIKATELRIALIENRKLVNSVLLLAYTDCYHKRRSIPVELMMAIR
ncbi:glycosyltransferase [Butyrivibrio sp. VCB2006]|uniref:glycosyltransferase n=1 Tax=Butyrivibrio sp. VCB2006 TaxID=1280679 RepID=UPI00041FA2B6|nr:glycosyltransferase [Butyrivibrio sp. VCB2006]